MSTTYGGAATLFTAAFYALGLLGGPLKSFEQALQEHHIALTKDALVTALQNPDAEVRWLAASKLLVNDRALDTIPLIEGALEREDVPHTRINTAFALAQVGDDVGFSTLQNACEDVDLGITLRVQAAGYLLQIGRESCIGTIMEALQLTDEVGNPREVALSLVPRFKHLSEIESGQLTSIVVKNLTNNDAVTRASASHALSVWGKTSAIPDLQRAVRDETDDTTRAQMERDLTHLSGPQKATPQ